MKLVVNNDTRKYALEVLNKFDGITIPSTDEGLQILLIRYVREGKIIAVFENGSPIKLEAANWPGWLALLDALSLEEKSDMIKFISKQRLQVRALYYRWCPGTVTKLDGQRWVYLLCHLAGFDQDGNIIRSPQDHIPSSEYLDCISEKALDGKIGAFFSYTDPSEDYEKAFDERFFVELPWFNNKEDRLKYLYEQVKIAPPEYQERLQIQIKELTQS